MKRTLLWITIILLPFSMKVQAGNIPLLGNYLSPDLYYISLEFPANSNPVLRNACYAAASRWDEALRQVGTNVRFVIVDSQFPHRGKITLGNIGNVNAAVSNINLYASDKTYPRDTGNNAFITRLYVHSFNIQLNYSLASAATVENQFPQTWEQDYNFTYRVVLHELGHVLGFQHPDWCGVSVVSSMNSRAKDAPPDLTAYDIGNLAFFYATHNRQDDLWNKLVDVKNIQNPTTRKRRREEILSQLNALAISRLAEGYNYPNLYYYGVTGPFVPNYVPAIDGSP